MQANHSSRIGRQLEVEALMQAVRWPNPDRRAVLILAGLLLAGRRFEEGYDYFSELAKAEPDQPLFDTLAGVFQVRTGQDVGQALARLDAAAEREPGLANYFRGLVLAEAPGFAGRLDTVISDLELVVAVKDQFPAGFLRAARRALAKGYAAQGRHEEAGTSLQLSGYADLAADVPVLITDWSVSAREGIRLTSPRFIEPTPGVHVAQGFDFSDFAFVETSVGVVAIDTSSSTRHAAEALARLRRTTSAPITHVILTHAHWDHVGGLAALTGPGTRVIAQANFGQELALQNSVPVISPYFLPEGESQEQHVTPDQLISAKETLTVGGVEFVLYPTRGGETQDGLLVYLPEPGVVFAGDMIMPYIGAPFLPEGSVEGLFEAMRLVQDLNPRMLIHGHAALTEVFTIEIFPALEAALREVYDMVLTAIGDGQPLSQILDRNYLPGFLRDHPTAVVYYLMIRDNLIKRVHHQRTGYWKSGGEGVEDHSPIEWATALSVLAGGRQDAFAEAAQALLDRGAEPLALKIADYGLLLEADDEALNAVRRVTLYRLIERNQQINPFKFVYYSGLAGLRLPTPR
jgi:glyoxylase-like metal-dependent hydrolase (beta-lactamase superfamily II)